MQIKSLKVFRPVRLGPLTLEL